MMDDRYPLCDPEATVDAGSRALLVNEPEALSGLALEDVLTQLLKRTGDLETTPLELAQRLFDSDNPEGAGVFSDAQHCDSEGNAAHANGPAAFCPRVEGVLATSDGFFTPGHPDHFYPVAVVNRMDLMGSAAFTCGELRIIYAKESGLTDPDNRVFLIFEVSLFNLEPGNAGACLPVAVTWKQLEEETDAAGAAAKLRSFLFEGLPEYPAPLQPGNLGRGAGANASYYGSNGQIRVSEHMAEHWQMRQMVADVTDSVTLRFRPTTLGSNPLPGRFEPKMNDPSDAEFALDFATRSAELLAATEVDAIRLDARPEDLSGESALGGDAVNDYAARGAENEYLLGVLALRIEERGLGADCPPDDPLTPEALLRRATMESCAGCHAPALFLGPERKIGCGLTWPASLGEVHIDEKGRLSEALTDVFLPRRAEHLTELLRTCQ